MSSITSPTTSSAQVGVSAALAWFADMMGHCYDFAEAAKAQGRPVVGILCEFTPREIILAAGAVPVCLCGGSAAMIPAAEKTLPANLGPLIKSTFGYHVTGKNPFLQWSDLVVAETTCDGKTKMFELMAETKPMHVLELPAKADDADACAHWCGEVRKLKAHLEHRFGVTITDDKLHDAIRLMNRERAFANVLEMKSSLAVRAGEAARLTVAIQIHVGAGNRLVVRAHHLPGESEVGHLEFHRVHLNTVLSFGSKVHPSGDYGGLHRVRRGYAGPLWTRTGRSV